MENKRLSFFYMMYAIITLTIYCFVCCCRVPS